MAITWVMKRQRRPTDESDQNDKWLYRAICQKLWKRGTLCTNYRRERDLFSKGRRESRIDFDSKFMECQRGAFNLLPFPPPSTERCALIIVPTADVADRWRLPFNPPFFCAVFAPPSVGQFFGGNHDLKSTAESRIIHAKIFVSTASMTPFSFVSALFLKVLFVIDISPSP